MSHRKTKYSPGYLVRQAFVGMWRNIGMTLASILVLLACLVVTGSFYGLIVNLNYNLRSLGDLNQIVIYVNEFYTEGQVEDIQAQVAALKTSGGAPAVEGTRIITKSQALAEEKSKYAAQYPHLFETITDADNPYRDSIVITYTADADVNDLEAKLTVIDGVENIVSRAEVAETVENVKGSVSVIFAGFMIILFVVTLFVIVMTIRLAVMSRSKEIMIMRYVGATKSFVMTPFILEGMLIGVFAAIIAFFVMNAVYTMVSGLLTGGYELLQVMPFQSMALTVLAFFACIGIVTGGGGSWISLRRYLKV